MSYCRHSQGHTHKHAKSKPKPKPKQPHQHKEEGKHGMDRHNDNDNPNERQHREHREHRERLPLRGTAPIKAVYLSYGADLFTYGDLGETIKKVVDFGYNLVILAFWIDASTGLDPYSAAWWWLNLDPSLRHSTLTYIHVRGAKITLAVGGATYNGYQLTGANSGTEFAQAASQMAKVLELDGLDFDMENFVSPGFTTSTGLTKAQSIQWLRDATNVARTILGPDALITHAPQSPYFSQPEFASGYLDFYLDVPAPELKPSVDAFLIQFYNQGSTYLTYQTQMITNDFHPGTAIAQLIQRGLPPDKIVMGKLTQRTDGQTESWVSPETLAPWILQAQHDPNVFFWHTGVSTWQFNTSGNPTFQWFINTIYPQN